MILATLLALHGDRMELSYFWSAILIVLLPVGTFVALGVWLFRMWRRERNQH
jgi:lipopolysaccharide export LptBFGC system permease protein LptF